MGGFDPDREWQRWREWLAEEPQGANIYEAVVAMMVARQMFQGFEMIHTDAPPDARRNAGFVTWLRRNYLESQAMAIRRQTDIRTDVVSLARLIDRVALHPDVLSRDRYAERVKGWESREQADGFFDEMVGAGLDHIDPETARRDLDDLLTECGPIRTWATKEIAHYDQKRGTFGQGITYGDLNAAIDIVVELSVKYRTMIMGVSMAKSVVMTPWQVVFRVPWIESDEALRDLIGKADWESRRLDRQ